MRFFRGRFLFFAVWFFAFPGRRILENLPELYVALIVAVILVGVIIHVRPRNPQTPSARGIRFVGPVQGGALPLADGARCLVCRSQLDGQIIYCASCHTPHHRECFRYAGACSVYACRAREYRQAA